MRSKQNRKKLIIAVATGVIASFAIFNSINSQKSVIDNLSQQLQKQDELIKSLKNNTSISYNSSIGPKFGTHKVIKVTKDLKAGTMLTAGVLEIQDASSNTESKDSFNDINLVVGQILAEDIKAGEPVIKSKVLDDKVLNLDIPVGMRAITIPFDYIQGFAPYITTGSRIDLISIGKDNQSRMFLQNIKIISMEGTGQQAQSNTSSMPVKPAITLQVPASAAPGLVNAIVNGKIHVVTRGYFDNKILSGKNNSASYSDKSNYPSKKFHLPPLPNSIQLTPPGVSANILPEPAAPPKMPQPKTVEIIQANVKSEMTFNND